MNAIMGAGSPAGAAAAAGTLVAAELNSQRLPLWPAGLSYGSAPKESVLDDAELAIFVVAELVHRHIQKKMKRLHAGVNTHFDESAKTVRDIGPTDCMRYIETCEDDVTEDTWAEAVYRPVDVKRLFIYENGLEWGSILPDADARIACEVYNTRRTTVLFPRNRLSAVNRGGSSLHQCAKFGLPFGYYGLGLAGEPANMLVSRHSLGDNRGYLAVPVPWPGALPKGTTIEGNECVTARLVSEAFNYPIRELFAAAFASFTQNQKDLFRTYLHEPLVSHEPDNASIPASLQPRFQARRGRWGREVRRRTKVMASITDAVGRTAHLTAAGAATAGHGAAVAMAAAG